MRSLKTTDGGVDQMIMDIGSLSNLEFLTLGSV